MINIPTTVIYTKDQLLQKKTYTVRNSAKQSTIVAYKKPHPPWTPQDKEDKKL